MVLVVHRLGRPLEIFTAAGGRLTGGELMWGRVRNIYRVDVSDHTLEWECRLPSEEDSFDFHAWLQLTCSVTDPVAVVENKIRDAYPVIEPALADTMQGVSRRFTLRDRATAEGALMSALRQRELEERISPVFRMTRIVVRLRLDPTIVDVNQKRKLHREFYLPIVHQGEWSQLALLLVQNPNELNNVIEGLRQQDQQAIMAQLAALELFMQGKDGDVEAHEYEPLRKKMLQGLFDGLRRGVDASSGFGPRRPSELGDGSGTIDAHRQTGPEGAPQPPDPPKPRSSNAPSGPVTPPPPSPSTDQTPSRGSGTP
jgi:hypothetical protein